MKQGTAIVYAAGTYGTYLDWALTTLTTDIAVIQPFLTDGSSHAFAGHPHDGMDKWRQYIASDADYSIVRVHPKTLKSESLSDNLNEIVNSIEKVIYIYTDPESILLVINNLFDKVWESWWDNHFLFESSIEKIYSKWPNTRGMPLAHIPVWIRREFLSYYLVPAWESQVEWKHPDVWSHDRCHVVYVRELLYQFKPTIARVLNFIDQPVTKPIDALMDLHKLNFSSQKNLCQDWLCQRIITHIVQNKFLDWSMEYLPLASQAWLQYRLRELGWEIECDGVDHFPKNSVQLTKLLHRL